MFIIIIILVILINFILGTTVFPYISIYGVVPNIALLVVMYLGSYKGRIYGGILGIIIGLINDILFSSIIGVNALILFFAGYLVGIGEDRIIKDNMLIPIALALAGTIYYNFIYYIFMYFLSAEITFLSYAKTKLLIELIYNLVLAIPIYKIFSKIYTVPQIRFGSK